MSSQNPKTRAAKQAAINASAASGNEASAEAETADNPECSPSTVAVNAIMELQSTLEKAMREMAQVNSLLQDLQTDVSIVKASQTKMATDIADLYDKLEQADARIMDLEAENGRLDKEAKERARQFEMLRRAVQDMENRDRRVNLRLVGVKERAEDGKPRELVRAIISQSLGVQLSQTELQRAHRSPGPLPDEGQPPRPIIIRFHSYLEKERVLAAARQRFRDKEGIVWNGCKISIFPDMTRDVVEKRRKLPKSGGNFMTWTSDSRWPTLLHCVYVERRKEKF